MSIIMKENYTIVTRHFIFLFYLIARSLFLLAIAGALHLFVLLYRESLSNDIVHFLFFPLIFVLVNYSFLRLALGLIRYYNRLIIIVRDKFIVMNSSLILQEDLEIMDLSKVMKIDVECHGILASFLGYGHLIMEQAKDEVRIIHYVPKPFKILQILREKTNYIGGQGDELKFFKVR